MNKTININLGGFFFHIDEEAYQKLRRYLDAISNSLSEDPQGKNEIIADIEARISELLSEKITDARQVVNQSDIDDIIGIMGQPEDYVDGEESYSNAHYAYQRNNTSSKKLFRDGDDKFLGGVAAGIAHYFNIDTIWIRLVFLLFLVGGGFSLLIYIILWILLPEAKTTAEKLQMEGEPVNIDNIEKKIRNEFTALSERIKDGANELSDKFSNADFTSKGEKARAGLQDFLEVLGKIIIVLFKVIGKFIGVLLIIVAAAVIISLIIGGFSIGSLEILNFDGDFIQYPLFFYDSVLPTWLLTLFAFVLIGVPFLVLFVLGLRILSSNVKQFSKVTSLSLLGIWIIALLGIVFTGIEFGSSHASIGKSVEKKSLHIMPNDTLNIHIKNDDNIYYQSNLRRSSEKHEVEVNNKRKIYSNNVSLDVEKSNTKEAYIIIEKNSRGRNKFNAAKNAKKILYKYHLEKNSIVLDAFYLSDVKNLWREEKVKIILYIPKNITVYFENSTRNFLFRIDNTTDTYDRDMAKHYFLMTEEGLHSEQLKAQESEGTKKQN